MVGRGHRGTSTLQARSAPEPAPNCGKLALGLTVAVPVTGAPLILFNPDFALSAVEWFELGAVPVAWTSVAWALGRAAARMLRSPAALGGAYGALAGWVSCVAVGGAIVSGPWAGAALALGVLGPVVVLPRWGPRGKRLCAWLGSAAGLAWLAAMGLAVGASLSAPKPDRQLVMVGLDGASWDLIDRFRAEGRLPNFDRLVKEGARGELETVSPLLSPSLWTTIASGKRPEQHGVVDFWTSALRVRAKRLWDVAGESGLRVGVFGYLVTWPPLALNGFLVPGFLAQDTRTHPPRLSFVKELETAEQQRAMPSPFETLRLGYAALRNGATLSSLNLAASLGSGTAHSREHALGGRLLTLAIRSDIFCHLMRRERPELAVFYDRQIDAVGHLYFRYFEPQRFPDVTPAEVAEYGEAIPLMYEASDAVLGRIRRCVAPDATLMVVSDHGQRAAPKTRAFGFVVKSTHLLSLLALEEEVRATNLGSLVQVRAAAPHVDMERVSAALTSVTRVSNGRPVFDVRRRDAQSLILSTRPGLKLHEPIRIRGTTLPASELLAAAGRISGEHTSTAVLLMAGPDVEPGLTLAGGSQLDVAPTALALLGLPIARDLEGRILSDALRPVWRARFAPSYVDSYGFPTQYSEQESAELNEETIELLHVLGYRE